MRLPGLAVLAIGFAASWTRSRRESQGPSTATLTYAACMLVAVSGVWGSVALPAEARDGSTCAAPLAPFAIYRAVGAVLVLMAVAMVVRLLGANVGAIGMQLGSRAAVGAAIAALLIIGLAATVVGPIVAEPFFGPLPVDLGNIAALVPALVFAIANASMEETIYRGALLRWLSPIGGVLLALVVQAGAFGLAHGVGGDFVGSPVPVIAATAVGGMAFGIVALRTGSLLLPIAIHAGLDIPIYYANACLQL